MAFPSLCCLGGCARLALGIHFRLLPCAFLDPMGWKAHHGISRISLLEGSGFRAVSVGRALMHYEEVRAERRPSSLWSGSCWQPAWIWGVDVSAVMTGCPATSSLGGLGTLAGWQCLPDPGVGGWVVCS